MTPERAMQLNNVRDTFQHLLKISQLLSTGLDPESLTLCVRLCEMGVNPEALAFVVKELRKMAETESEPKGNA